MIGDRLDRQVDGEALEEDDDAEDEDHGAKVHQDVQVLAGGEQVEQGDDGALEISAPASVDGGWGEAPPDDRLADVAMKR